MTKRKNQRHSCELCGASLKTRFSLQRHFAQVHLPELEGRVPSKQKPKPDEVLAGILPNVQGSVISRGSSPRKRRRAGANASSAADADAAAAVAPSSFSASSSSSNSLTAPSRSKTTANGQRDRVPQMEDSWRARTTEVAASLEPKGGWTRCPECGLAFVTASDVRAHVRRDHLGL